VNQIRNTIIMVRTCRRVRNSQDTMVRILNGNTQSAPINQKDIIHSITNCRSSPTIQTSHFAQCFEHGPFVRVWMEDLKQVHERSRFG